MKKILILGSSPDLTLFVKSAKRKGYYTIVADANPLGDAKKFADKSYDIDVHDINTLEKTFTESPVDGITTGCSEVLLDCYVELASRLCLRHYISFEQLRKVRVKSCMKEMLCSVGVKTPKNVTLTKDFKNDELIGLNWPLVIKPEDSYGSRGVYIVNDHNELRQKFEHTVCHSKFKNLLAEEYCADDEHNLLFWVENGKPHLLYLSDRPSFGRGQKSVGYCFYHFYISKDFDEILPYAMNTAYKIINALGYKEGPLSVQFFYKNGELHVNEVAGRIFGFGDPIAVRKLNGFGPEDLLIDFALSNNNAINWDTITLNRKTNFCTLYMYANPGTISLIEGLDYVNKIPEIFGCDIYFKQGDKISLSGNRFTTAASFFISSSEPGKLHSLFTDIYRNFKFIGTKGENLIIPFN
jgi:biotin carboxylase